MDEHSKRMVKVLHLEELTDEEIQVAILQGLGILSIRENVGLTDLIRDMLEQIEQEQLHKPVEFEQSFGILRDRVDKSNDNDPED